MLKQRIWPNDEDRETLYVAILELRTTVADTAYDAGVDKIYDVMVRIQSDSECINALMEIKDLLGIE